jgi:hypothetical protein
MSTPYSIAPVNAALYGKGKNRFCRVDYVRDHDMGRLSRKI